MTKNDTYEGNRMDILEENRFILIQNGGNAIVVLKLPRRNCYVETASKMYLLTRNGKKIIKSLNFFRYLVRYC